MAYRGLTADNPPVSREVAPGVSVSNIFADIDDFQSKLVACFHSNSNLPGVIMRYATALRIAPNHPHLPGTAIKLAQHLRRTFDLLPVHRRYDEFTVVGVIQACLPHSAQVALEAASRRADEPIDSYSTICRHLEAIDLESPAAFPLRMPVTRRAAAAATMADHAAAAAAAAAAGFEAMEIDTHVARVIQVELAKTKTRVPTRDIINASRILGDRREVRQLIAFFTELRELIAGIYWTPALEAWILRQFPPESDAGMAYRGLTADNPPVSREVAPGVSVSTIFADIDDFLSKLVACFHSNSNLPGVIMRYATALRIAPNHPHLPGTAIKLAQHLRRTFDLLPVHRRYDEFTVVGVIQACLPHSAQVALEAASRRADEPIDSYSTICRHLEAIDLESPAAFPLRMPVTRRAAAAATMADHAAAAAAAAAAAGFEAMEIDTHVARVIQVELAKTKTRVPTRDIINASRILGDRREVRQLIAFFTYLRELIAGIYWTPALEAWILRQFPPESDAGMAYRGLTADNPPVSREVAPGVSVSTIFADIDDFLSKLVACFHSNSNLPGVIMRYATALRIAPNHPHLPGTAIKLAQHLRRTFDLLPVHRRYDEFTVVGVIQACLPHSAQVALEAASRRADEPIDSYSTICRHLEAIDLEFAAAANGKRKYTADAPPHRYIRPGASPFPPAGPSTPPPPHLAPTPATPRLSGYDRYDGKCDGCGRMGHSIMKCSSTSEADKQAWRQTVAANKAAKGITKLNLNRPAGQ
eukprot:jgi/Tetstr1/457064/TSEL_043726.t1